MTFAREFSKSIITDIFFALGAVWAVQYAVQAASETGGERIWDSACAVAWTLFATSQWDRRLTQGKAVKLP